MLEKVQVGLNTHRDDIYEYIVCLAVCLVLVGGVWPVQAQSQLPVERQIKAAFVSNFVRFAQWSANDVPLESSTTVGVVDISDVLAFQNLAAKSEHKVEVVKYDPSQLGQCRVVYVNTSDRDLARHVIRHVQGHHVLTIGEMSGFVQMGGIINFYQVGGKIRFEVNVAAARQEGIKLSSKLLKLSRIVEE